MFILNADKDVLVDIAGKTLGVCSYPNGKYAISVSNKVKDNCEDILFLTEYSTKKRAEEVLQEIANELPVYCMPQE